MSRRAAFLIVGAAVTGAAMVAACSDDTAATSPVGADGAPNVESGPPGDALAATEDVAAPSDAGPSDAPSVDAIADAGPGVPDAPFVTDSGFVFTPATPGARCRSLLLDASTGQITCAAPLDCCESIGAPAQCLGADADVSSCFSVSACDGPEDCALGQGCVVLTRAPKVRVGCVTSPDAGAELLCHTRADCPNGEACCVPKTALPDGGYEPPSNPLAYVSGGCIATPGPSHACD